VKGGKIYHFDASAQRDLQPGDIVVVETSRGRQLGEITVLMQKPAQEENLQLKAIERRATVRDLLLRQVWAERENEALTMCRTRARELNLNQVKIISAEYNFDGTRLTIQFSSDTEDRVDIKSLRQDMQRKFSNSQVEIRQIGPRDLAKMVGGLGACGLENRCCCQFLGDFNSISIRMAKEQGISLTPTEITGICGRLRCCLIYEYDFYCEARAQLPKRNRHVTTPQGDGRVVDINPLKGTIFVELPDVGVREFTREETTLLEEGQEPAPHKAPPLTPPQPLPTSPPARHERHDRPRQGRKGPHR
jgi:cell fate regulator YaaT (PSP1 superfamily)